MCCIRTDANDHGIGERFLRFLCCFSWASKLLSTKPRTPREKVKSLLEHMSKTDQAEQISKIREFFAKRNLEILRRRKFTGPFVGSLTKQLLQ